MKHSVKTLSFIALLSVTLYACSAQDADKAETKSKPVNKQQKLQDTANTQQKASENSKDFEPSYIEGEDYTVLKKPYDTGVSDKVVVYEFFGYLCPHCFSFEPFLKKFIDDKPDYAILQRIPQSYHESWFVLQQGYSTAQMMDFNNEELHQKLFTAIHKQGLRFSSIEQLATWYEKEAGIDKKKFLSTAESFIIDSKQRQADKMAFLMQVTSTPSMVVNGKYAISKKVRNRDEVINIAKFLTKKAAKEMGLIK